MFAVTPHAQNTGTSSGFIVTRLPKSGLSISAMPIPWGSPIHIGLPCALGIREVTSRAPGSMLLLIGRMVTAMGPQKGPAVFVMTLVTYIGIGTFSSLCLMGIPAFMSVRSKVKLPPMKKVTRSSRQNRVISLTVSVTFP